MRSMLESSMADIKADAADAGQVPCLLQLLAASLEHACMAFASNQELVLCLKDLQVRLTLKKSMGPLTLHCSTCLSRSKPRVSYDGRDSLVTGLHIFSPLYWIYGALPTGFPIGKGVKPRLHWTRCVG